MKLAVVLLACVGIAMGCGSSPEGEDTGTGGTGGQSGGTVYGLVDGTRLVLRNNTSDDLEITAEGDFHFAVRQIVMHDVGK